MLKWVHSYVFIKKCIKLFRVAQYTFNDKDRKKLQITALKLSNIEIVLMIIEEDTYATYKEIKALTSLHSQIILIITHDNLKLKKI